VHEPFHSRRSSADFSSSLKNDISSRRLEVKEGRNRTHALRERCPFDLRRYRDHSACTCTGAPGPSGRDHQIAALDLVITAHELPDRSDRSDYRRARWIGHEALQGLQRAAARRLVRERQHLGLARLEPGDRSLEHLHQTLLGERDAGERLVRFLAGRREPQLRRLPGYAERLQVLRSGAIRDRRHRRHCGVAVHAQHRADIGHVNQSLRRLSDRARRDHLVRQRIDRGDAVLVLEADIDPRAVTDGQMPWGSLPTGMVATLEKSLVR